MSKNSLTKVIIPCRLSYANVWEKKSINGGEAKYSVLAIIPKSDVNTIARINEAVKVAKNKFIDKYGMDIPKDFKLPLRDGDIEKSDDEVYTNCYFFNANSKTQPQIVDKKVRPILNENEVYSGCYGNISVNFYGYKVDANSGIAAGLGNIQKTRDGELLTMRVNADEEFQVIDDEFLRDF